MESKDAITSAENIVVQEHRRLVDTQRAFIFLVGLALLLLLLRLLRSVLSVRLFGPPLPGPDAAALLPQESPRAPESQVTEPQTPRVTPAAAGRKARPTPRRRPRPKKQARPQSSRRRLAERLLLVAEVTAVVLFLAAGVAAWQTLGELNDTYRNLQRVDARVLPTVMPAADPGRLAQMLAPDRQDEGLLPPFNLLPAPALPTPFPTSTPPPAAPTPEAPAPTAPASTASAATTNLVWGTSVVMSELPQGAEQARRVEIAAIEVDSFVYQNYGPEWLKLGVVQFGDNVAPGQPGNLVLAAHNDVYGEIFRDLDELEKGEEVTVYGDSRRYTYRVRDIVIVEPDETWVMLPTSSPTLTLISCYPYLVGTQRIVVFADYVP